MKIREFISRDEFQARDQGFIFQMTPIHYSVSLPTRTLNQEYEQHKITVKHSHDFTTGIDLNFN